MKRDLKKEVREFILKTFPLARKHRISDSDPLLESGVLDSMGVLEIVTFLDQELGIQVADEDLIPDHFRSIERIAAFIEYKTPANV